MGWCSSSIDRFAYVVFLRDFSHVVIKIPWRSLEFESPFRSWPIKLFEYILIDFVVWLVLFGAMTVANSQLHGIFTKLLGLFGWFRINKQKLVDRRFTMLFYPFNIKVEKLTICNFKFFIWFNLLSHGFTGIFEVLNHILFSLSLGIEVYYITLILENLFSH